MKNRLVVTESTGWIDLELKAVSNEDHQIVVGERIYDKINRCYIKPVKIILPDNEKENLYNLLRHVLSDCDETCIYCKNESDDIEL